VVGGALEKASDEGLDLRRYQSAGRLKRTGSRSTPRAMSDDNTRILPITATIGASMVLFSTFLPWYSFEVVLPVQRVVHIFFVTTTLWGITTLAPIVIIAASFAAFVLSIFGPRPVANVIIALVGVGILAYGIVRCFDVPRAIRRSAVHARSAG
jgi:magnesium-transporting ATPase (P-type)